MQRERLTLERIRIFACPPGQKQAFFWDTEAPRLAVRATATGSKAFIFEAKLNRQTIRRTIGDVRAWRIDEARAEARRLQTLIDQGKDPRELDRLQTAAAEAAKAAEEAARREAEERARYTLRALCETYTAHLERTGKGKSAAAARSLFKCHVFEPHPRMAALAARDVSSRQVAAMVRKVREAGKERAAGILRSYLSAAFNAAKRAPFDSALPAVLIDFNIEHNPVDAIPAIPVQRGDRTLSAAELRAYLGHLLRVGQADAIGPELPDMVLLLALTAGGQRLAQLLRAKVGDYDPDTATLRLWDPKGKRAQPREHALPLAPLAAARVVFLVERAKRRETARAKEEGRAADTAGAWIFSTHGRVPMSLETASNRAADICARMGGAHFTLRDIRRTVETMLAAMGISKDTRAQLLSHGISGVQAAHYDRHTYADEKRAALVAWEARLSAIAGAEPAPANVVKLRAA